MGAFIPKGSTAKALPAINKIQLKQVQIIEGDGDPNALPVVAQDGSIFMSKTAGRVYFKSSTVWVDNTQALIDFIATKGQPNGIAPLDVNGKVTESFLPSSIVGALKFKGTWDASTNTPALASGVGANGDIYIVSVAGATDLDGITDWNVGDWAVFNSTSWQKVDNTDLVVSINGKSGVVVLNHADLAAIAGTGGYHFSAEEHDGLEGVDCQMTGILLGPSSGNRSRLRQSGTDAVELESELGSGVGITARGPNDPIMPDTVFITNSTSNARLTQDGTVKVSAPNYEANIDDDTLVTGKYVDEIVRANLWSTRTLTNVDSPFTVVGSKTIYVCDTSAGNIEIVLPTISASLVGHENRFVKAAPANSVKISVNGGVQTIGSKTAQYIWEEGGSFGVVASDLLSYLITQDNRKVDTFETPVGVWAKTSSIEHWDLSISTLGTGATFNGNNHGATLTTGTTVSTIYSKEVSTEEVIANQNYFAFVTNCSTDGVFNLIVEGWNGSAWVEVGGLVTPFEAGDALNGLVPFVKTGYTKWRLKLTNSGTAAGLTCTIARGEWTDAYWKSVQLKDDTEETSYSGYITVTAGAPIQFKTKEKDTATGKYYTVSSSGAGTIYTVVDAKALFDLNAGCASTAVAYPCVVAHKNAAGTIKKLYYDALNTNVKVEAHVQARAINVEVGDYFYVYSGTGSVTDSSSLTFFSITATPIGTSKGIVAQADMDNSIGEILISANSTAPFGFASTLNKSFGKTGADYSGDSYRKLYEYMWSLPAINVSTTASKGYRLNAASKGANWLADWDAGNVIFVDLSGEHLRIDGALAGSHVADAMQGHKHYEWEDGGNRGAYYYPSVGGNPSGMITVAGNQFIYKQFTGTPYTDGTNGTPRTADETRVKATYHYAYIRYSNAPATVIAPVAVVDSFVCGIGGQAGTTLAMATTDTNIARVTGYATTNASKLTEYFDILDNATNGTRFVAKKNFKLGASLSADNSVTTGGLLGISINATALTTRYQDLPDANKLIAASGYIDIAGGSGWADIKTGDVLRLHAGDASFSNSYRWFKLIFDIESIETGTIASHKSEIHKHATYLSSNETEAGYCEFTGKKIYKRTIYFPSAVTTTNSNYTNIGQGLSIVNAHNEGAYQQFHGFGFGTSYIVLEYTASTGVVSVRISGTTYSIRAGSKFTIEYTKD